MTRSPVPGTSAPGDTADEVHARHLERRHRFEQLELDSFVPQEALLERRHGIVENDLAVIDHDHPPAQLLHIASVM